MKERSLVLFTVLMQAAVGLMLVLGYILLFRCLLELTGGHSLSRQIELPELYYGMVGLLAAGGLCFSFFHLGHPERAYRAIFNLRSSRLSQEILFSLLFFIAWAAFWLFVLKWEGLFWVEAGFGFLVAILGASAVDAIARVYQLEPAPGWGKKFVDLDFRRTTLILGLTSSALVFSVAALRENVDHQNPMLVISLIGFFLGGVTGGVAQLSIWVYSSKLFAGRSARLLNGLQALWIVAAIGIGLFVLLFSTRLTSIGPGKLAILAALLFALTFQTELALRSRFYLLRRPIM